MSGLCGDISALKDPRDLKDLRNIKDLSNLKDLRDLKDPEGQQVFTSSLHPWCREIRKQYFF